MQKKNLFFLILSCLLLSSCCEFLEEIQLNKSGSGHATLTIDAKESAPLLAFLMNQSGQKIVPEMPPLPTAEELQKHAKTLEIKLNEDDNGIHNAQLSVDLQQFKVTFSADFESLAAWNHLLQNIQFDQYQLQSFFNYSFKDSFFTRKVADQIVQNLANARKDPTSQESQMLNAFRAARYKFVLSYEKPIRGNTANTAYQVSEKQISMQGMVAEFLENPAKMDLKIKL